MSEAPAAPAPTTPQSPFELRVGQYLHPPVLHGVTDDELRPEMMKEFPRAQFFPELERDTLTNLRVGLFTFAATEIAKQEEHYGAHCRTPEVVRIEEFLTPWKTWDEIWSRNVRLVAQETWYVNRCGTEASYRVQYLRHNDFYYVKTIPGSLGGKLLQWRARARHLLKDVFA